MFFFRNNLIQLYSIFIVILTSTFFITYFMDLKFVNAMLMYL